MLANYKKTIGFLLLLTFMPKSYPNLIIRVSEDQFTRTLQDNSVVILLKDIIPTQAFQPVKLPKFGQPVAISRAPAFGQQQFGRQQAKPELLEKEEPKETMYTYITQKGGFYFLTSTNQFLHFNNLVIEGEQAVGEVVPIATIIPRK